MEYRPKSLLHNLLAGLFILSWLGGVAGMYLAYRFHQTASKTPGEGAVFEINNHGDVRYLTEAQYYGSFGLLFGSVFVALLSGVGLSIVEKRDGRNVAFGREDAGM